MVIRATALLMVASTSFAGRRQRPGRAKVCSTTQRRGANRSLANVAVAACSVVKRDHLFDARQVLGQ